MVVFRCGGLKIGTATLRHQQPQAKRYTQRSPLNGKIKKGGMVVMGWGSTVRALFICFRTVAWHEGGLSSGSSFTFSTSSVLRLRLIPWLLVLFFPGTSTPTSLSTSCRHRGTLVPRQQLWGISGHRRRGTPSTHHWMPKSRKESRQWVVCVLDTFKSLSSGCKLNHWEMFAATVQ